MKTYRTIDEFYAARGGELSRESDYGVQWCASEAGQFPLWRVSYVKETGDVYATRQRNGVGPEILLLGTVPPIETPDTDFDTAWDKPLDDLLPEWWIVCGTPFSLQWVQQQLQEYPPKPVDLGNALAATLMSDDGALD